MAGAYVKPDPERARENYARAAFRVYADRINLNKAWEQLSADAKAAWCCAADEMRSAMFAELDQEETSILMLKLAMKDALTDDHISQLVMGFHSKAGFPGKVRIIIAPERISIPFEAPLQGRHDG